MNYFALDYSFLPDRLSLFFLAVIFLVSLPSAIYSLGYMHHAYTRPKRVMAGALLCLFVASMAFVVTLRNALIFLVAWEVMSLVSYFLVIFDTEQKKSLKAGTIYIIMTHIGTACITAALLVIFAYSRSFDFTVMKAACVTMPGGTRTTVFLLFLIGFGTKAGLVPMHVWLPYAHPQAPSHISGIMSGVMIKTAVYGMLRFIISIVGVPEALWGNLLMILASVTCLVGVTYALMENDIKRLLAYSSVENMGIILLGVGAAMTLAAMHLSVLAVFALTAALYHLVNHAVFKSLLFMGAGSVYTATGTRNIEKLGGLAKVMPWTAGAFLAGSLAISALPPFNGFVSEWLTLQAFFLGAISSASIGMKVFFGSCAAALALTGGMTAACFVKAFGITFLAMPRSQRAKEARETALSMRWPMVFMAALTLGMGLAAVPMIRLLIPVAGEALGIDTAGIHFTAGSLMAIPSTDGIRLSMPLIAALLAGIALIAWAVYGYGRSRRTIVTGRTWGCGYYALDARTEYTSTAFSKPFRIAFSFFLMPYRKTLKIHESHYHVTSVTYETMTTPIFRRYIYELILKITFLSAKRLRKLQPGSIHLYLGYIFMTVLILIMFMNRF